MKGQFFAIGKPQWNEACKLGLNAAVALLALGRGTGHDNATTAWSAKAISGYTGMSWVRANNALALLDRNPRIVANVTPNGKRRLRKLVIPEDSARWLWLPNALVAAPLGDQCGLRFVGQFCHLAIGRIVERALCRVFGLVSGIEDFALEVVPLVFVEMCHGLDGRAK